MLGIGIDTLVTFNPVTVSADTPLGEAVRLMNEHGIHHLPVVDGDWQLVGMVSDHDVARVVEQLPALMGFSAHDPQFMAAAKPTVAEALTQNVHYIEPGDPPEAALELIIENHFHCVPLAHRGRLEGIITSTDFLRELSYGDSPLARQKVIRAVRPSLPRIEASASLDQASAIMHDAEGYLLMFDGAIPLGVLSDRQLRRGRLGDLLGEVAGVEQPAPAGFVAERVGDLLPLDVAGVTLEQTLAAAAREMFSRRVQGLLAFDATRRLRGAVTETELLRALLG